MPLQPTAAQRLRSEAGELGAGPRDIAHVYVRVLSVAGLRNDKRAADQACGNDKRAAGPAQNPALPVRYQARNRCVRSNRGSAIVA